MWFSAYLKAIWVISDDLENTVVALSRLPQSFGVEFVEPFVQVLCQAAEVHPLIVLLLNEVVRRLQDILGAVFKHRFCRNLALALSRPGFTALGLGLVLVWLLKQSISISISTNNTISQGFKLLAGYSERLCGIRPIARSLTNVTISALDEALRLKVSNEPINYSRDSPRCKSIHRCFKWLLG